jgi:hypothetical protein
VRRALIWLVVLLCVGLIWAGAQAPEHYPVPAQQAIEQRHHAEVAQQESEEQERQAQETDNEESQPPVGSDEH